MTCARCLSGRHLACRCGCSVCVNQFKGSAVKTERKPRKKPGKPRIRTTEQRRLERPPSRSSLVGFKTSLDHEDLPLIEFYLGCGLGASEIAHRTGFSRDKVRIVQREFSKRAAA